MSERPPGAPWSTEAPEDLEGVRPVLQQTLATSCLSRDEAGRAGTSSPARMCGAGRRSSDTPALRAEWRTMPSAVNIEHDPRPRGPARWSTRCSRRVVAGPTGSARSPRRAARRRRRRERRRGRVDLVDGAGLPVAGDRDRQRLGAGPGHGGVPRRWATGLLRPGSDATVLPTEDMTVQVVPIMREMSDDLAAGIRARRDAPADLLAASYHRPGGRGDDGRRSSVSATPCWPSITTTALLGNACRPFTVPTPGRGRGDRPPSAIEEAVHRRCSRGWTGHHHRGRFAGGNDRVVAPATARLRSAATASDELERFDIDGARRRPTWRLSGTTYHPPSPRPARLAGGWGRAGPGRSDPGSNETATTRMRASRTVGDELADEPSARAAPCDCAIAAAGASERKGFLGPVGGMERAQKGARAPARPLRTRPRSSSARAKSASGRCGRQPHAVAPVMTITSPGRCRTRPGRRTGAPSSVEMMSMVGTDLAAEPDHVVVGAGRRSMAPAILHRLVSPRSR